MKRYVRTADGMIFDLTKKHRKPIEFDKNDVIIVFGLHFKVFKESNSIEELIDTGDLVHDAECNEIFEIDELTIFDYSAFDRLYTKVGRNYLLSAEKVKGKWRTIR